ncbi:OTU protein [Thecaphora frezii]
MPSKKNKKSKPANSRANDSLRADIAATQQHVDPFADDAGDDSFDIADQLLAALDARDALEAEQDEAAKAEKAEKENGHHFRQDLRNAGEKILSNLQGGSSSQIPTALPGTSPNSKKAGLMRMFGSKSPEESGTPSPQAGKKKSRQQQRKEKKAAEQEAMRREVEAELKVNGGKPDEAALERQGIDAMCAALKVQMHEITPDGHCLYAAVADQLMFRGKSTVKLDYKQTRKATADMMREHPEDFVPFISDSDEHMAGIDNKEAGQLDETKAQTSHFLKYCDAIESTGVWGGQPEILALSRAFKTQINVVQAGSPVLKVGEGEYPGEPLTISYHRKMYGLGEHYNSLRPIS